MVDLEIIQLLKLGDEKAFERVFKNHFTGLCLFAEHFLKDSHHAEEIVEDLFCNLWENCKTIDIAVSLKAYLYKSVYYQCLKFIRHQKVEKKYKDNQGYFLADNQLNDINSQAYPVANLIVKELEDKIEAEINLLPPQCKEIFCLSRFDNLSYAEIAEKLNLSVNTVKTQMSRALQKLRDELKDYLAVLALVFTFYN